MEGMRVSGGSVSMNASSTVTANGTTQGGSGIRVDGRGSLTIGDPGFTGDVAQITNNGAFGILFAGGAVSDVSCALITNNGRAERTSLDFAQTLSSDQVTLSGCDQEQRDGRAARQGGPDRRRGQHGGAVRGQRRGAERPRRHRHWRGGPSGATAGAVSADFEANGVQKNGGVGVAMAQAPGGGPVNATFNGNDVTQNGASGVMLPSATGMVFGSGALTGFAGNSVHGNANNQVSFGQGTWDIAGPSGCSGTPNAFYCYGNASVGVEARSGAVVNATSDAWSHALPAANVDYSGNVQVVGGGGIIQACTAVTTCP